MQNIKKQQDSWAKTELLEIAKWQKSIQWLFLAHFVAVFIPYATILPGIIGIYIIYKMASSLRSTYAWLYLIVSFIPIIGLLALLHFLGKATQVLKANGIRVGIMGAKMADFN